jgi:HTH-type transcriptional regulator/antitoxin HigA
MDKLYDFEPDWTVHPGRIVKEFLDDDEYTNEAFAKKVGWSVKFLEDLLDGKTSITNDMAEKFCKVLGMSKQFWLNLQANYEEDLIRLKKAKQQEKIVPEYHQPVLTPLTAKAGG